MKRPQWSRLLCPYQSASARKAPVHVASMICLAFALFLSAHPDPLKQLLQFGLDESIVGLIAPRKYWKVLHHFFQLPSVTSFPPPSAFKIPFQPPPRRANTHLYLGP